MPTDGPAIVVLARPRPYGRVALYLDADGQQVAAARHARSLGKTLGACIGNPRIIYPDRAIDAAGAADFFYTACDLALGMKSDIDAALDPLVCQQKTYPFLRDGSEEAVAAFEHLLRSAAAPLVAIVSDQFLQAYRLRLQPRYRPPIGAQSPRRLPEDLRQGIGGLGCRPLDPDAALIVNREFESPVLLDAYASPEAQDPRTQGFKDAALQVELNARAMLLASEQPLDFQLPRIGKPARVTMIRTRRDGDGTHVTITRPEEEP